jgi:hypothetical protein
MRTLFTARAIAASAAAATLITGGALPSASATGSSHRDDDDTAWVQVCQRVRGDGGDRARDRDNRNFRGTYRVEDEDDSQRVSLRGRRDCDTVEVVAGRVTVRIVRAPRDTERTGPRRFSFYIDEGETRTVTFRFRVADDDDHGHGDRIAA